MKNPAEMIRRAMRNARSTPAARNGREAVDLQPPAAHHAAYTRLMERHDRVRTQHLSGKRRSSDA